MIETLLRSYAMRSLGKIAAKARKHPIASANFSKAILYDLGIHVQIKDANNLPRSGPALIICNHPSGLMEGLIVSALLAEQGTPHLILGNELIRQIGEFRGLICGVDVFSPA